MTTRQEPTTISTKMEMRLVVPGTTPMPVTAGLRFSVVDPYAVHVTFHTGGTDGSDSVEWTFARQLLTDGLASSSGEGDVQVWPGGGDGSQTCLALSSPSGRALFEVPTLLLREFLVRTYDAVPVGAESAFVDLDAELALMLWAEPGL